MIFTGVVVGCLLEVVVGDLFKFEFLGVVCYVC